MLLHYFNQISTAITMDCFQTDIAFQLETTPDQIFDIVRKASESINFLKQRFDKVKYSDDWLYNTLARQERMLTTEVKHSLNTLILFCFECDKKDLANDLYCIGDNFEEFSKIDYDAFSEVFSLYIVSYDKLQDSTDLINLTKIHNYTKSINGISKNIEKYNEKVDIYNRVLLKEKNINCRHFVQVSEIIKRLFAYYEKDILKCEKHRYDLYAKRSRDNSCNDCLVHKNIFILMDKVYMYFQELYAKQELEKFVELHGEIENIEKSIDMKVDGINKLFEEKEEMSEKK